MKISSTSLKRCDLVKLSGRIDSSNADQLLEALQALNTKDRFKIVLDMSDVDFMSSKGWWALIQTQKACKRYNRGELLLANVPTRIQETLSLVGMNDYFKHFKDTTEAVGSF